jgi:type II secretion system protein H
LPVRRTAGFTLIEVVLSVFILMLLLVMAVPSVSGVMADRRLRQSLDRFNDLAHQAQQKSIAEHRAYLLTWTSKAIELRPETLIDSDGPDPVTRLVPARGESYSLALPFALMKDPPAEWIFWPSGTCEPAEVTFKSRNGTWTASYSALTAQAEIIGYAAR